MHQQRLRKEAEGLHAPDGAKRRKKHAAPRDDVAVPPVTNEEGVLSTHSFGNLATLTFRTKGLGPWFCAPRLLEVCLYRECQITKIVTLV